MRAVLQNRSLVILGVAESVSNVGNWVTMMALFALIVFRGEGSVLESSGILLAGLGPMLLFSPLAGWLTDRFDRKRLMIASQLLAALPIIAMILIGEGVVMYLLLALQSIFVAVMLPARQAVVPTLVAQENLTRANAFLQQLSSFIKIGAPIFGGALVGMMGPHRAMVLDVVTFVLAASILALLPSLPPARRAEKVVEEVAEPVVESINHAVWPVLRHSPQLRLLFIATFFVILVIMGFDVLAPIVIRDVLQADEGLFGLMIGLVGLGSVTSGAALMLHKGERDQWHDVLLGLLLLGALPATMAGATWLGEPGMGRWVIGAGALLGGLGSGFTTVQVGTLLQLLSPPTLLGRIGGIFQSTIAGAQLITIFATPILVPAFLPVGPFFALSTLALMVVAGGMVLTLRSASRHQVQLPV